MIKVLVTGVAGQLGYDVVKVLKQRNMEYLSADIAELDITDYPATEFCNPNVVIHCSAYTAVDQAENHPDIYRKVNVNGTENIAKVCKFIGRFFKEM